MPTAGLSLVGFLDQPAGINHLAQACVPANSNPVVLAAEWVAANAKLGPAFANAGHPVIQSIPVSHSQYIANLVALPWVAAHLASWPGAQFAMVEVDPLLAFQLTVDMDRSRHHCSKITNPPSLDELFNLCLPTTQSNETIHFQLNGQSAILKSRSLNVRTVAQGVFQQEDKIGIQFGVALPLAHVVRFNGRYYLHNGFHRAVGASVAGATMIPCIIRDVATFEEVGPPSFPQALLESANPPTVGHFSKGRAHDVNLRAFSRVIHVTWTDYVVPDEY